MRRPGPRGCCCCRCPPPTMLGPATSSRLPAPEMAIVAVLLPERLTPKALVLTLMPVPEISKRFGLGEERELPTTMKLLTVSPALRLSVTSPS